MREALWQKEIRRIIKKQNILADLAAFAIILCNLIQVCMAYIVGGKNYLSQGGGG